MSKDKLRLYRVATVAIVFQDPRAHINAVITIGEFLTKPMRVIRGSLAGTARAESLRLLEAPLHPDTSALLISRPPHPAGAAAG